MRQLANIIQQTIYQIDVSQQMDWPATEIVPLPVNLIILPDNEL